MEVGSNSLRNLYVPYIKNVLFFFPDTTNTTYYLNAAQFPNKNTWIQAQRSKEQS